jgi:hypothetical protein
MQTRLGSAIETGANIVIGFAINFCANLLVFPMFGVPLHASTAFYVGLVFTGISVVRSYVLRRVFNKVKARWNHAHPSH